MYYFYSILHLKANVSLLGISKHDPRVHRLFKSSVLPDNVAWCKLCQKHGRKDKRGNSLLIVKVLHESPDLAVIKNWKKYYFKCWNVTTNPKFIHSRIKRKYGLCGEKHPNYGKQYIFGRRVWYTNEHNNLYIAEGTQPSGYRRGRAWLNRRKSKSKHRSRKCMAPDGTVYSSMTEAGLAIGITPEAIAKRIKRGNKGWRFV